jgi:hypothetical protein
VAVAGLLASKAMQQQSMSINLKLERGSQGQVGDGAGLQQPTQSAFLGEGIGRPLRSLRPNLIRAADAHHE